MHPDSFIKILTDNRLILVATLLVTMMLAYQLSLLVWQIIPQPDYAAFELIEESSSAQTVEQGLSISQKTSQIASRNLFGKAVSNKVEATPAQVQDAPESSLNYKLRGIYYSADKALASIILQKNSKDSKFYRLGDEIDLKIYIEQIHQDHILISRQGRLEKLVLEKPKMDVKSSSRIAANRSINRPASASAKVLQSYKRRYADNPLALAKRFQAIPVSENGKNIGYKLKALRGERLLKKLNMQPDDVFVAVNGIGLDKPFQALDALKSLTTANNVSITVIRNGNRETLDFNLQ